MGPECQTLGKVAHFGKMSSDGQKEEEIKPHKRRGTSSMERENEAKAVLQKGGELSITFNDACNLAKQSATQRQFVNSMAQTNTAMKMP